MYEAFDKFLATSTWHTRHPSDEERFFKALNRVVRDDKFDPDEMGKHMAKKKPVSTHAESETYFQTAIDHYVAAAWAVRDFLRVAGK